MGKIAPGSISSDNANVARATVTTADSSTINDTNFVPGDAVAGQAWKRILIFPRFTAGTSPTVTVQPLFRAASGWVAISKTTPLSQNEGYVIDVMGRDVFLRIDTITGTPTNVSIYVGGWEPFTFGGSPAR